MYTASAVQLVPTMMVAPLLLSVRKSRPNSKLLKISWVGISIKSRLPRNWEKRPNTTREVAPVVAITKVAVPENKAIIRGKRTLSKLSNAIKKMETEVGLSDNISVFSDLLKWLRASDPTQAKEVTPLLDAFVKSKVS